MCFCVCVCVVVYVCVYLWVCVFVGVLGCVCLCMCLYDNIDITPLELPLIKMLYRNILCGSRFWIFHCISLLLISSNLLYQSNE